MVDKDIGNYIVAIKRKSKDEKNKKEKEG